MFFKVFTTVLATFIIIAGITRPERIPQMQYMEIAQYDNILTKKK